MTPAASDLEDVTTDAPTCRATIRDGLVTLNRWTPGLFGPGPEPAAFRTIVAALADLRIDGDELIVTPVPRTQWTADAEAAILGWAPAVGYRRVWLPSRVVTFGDPAPPLGCAAVTCPTCGATWEDGSAGFWERVRSDGWFPARCPACGGSLPEWSVTHGGGETDGAVTDSHVSETATDERPSPRG